MLSKILLEDNIAEVLDDEKLEEIAGNVWKGYEEDVASRDEWRKTHDKALKLALQVSETKSFPWPKASNVKYPLVTFACLQFNARAYPFVVPGPEIVKHRVVGKDDDGEKARRAKRVSEHMSYQLMEENEDWESGMDSLTMVLPLVGWAAKKTYYDGAVQSDLVLPNELVVDYWAKSFQSAERITQDLMMSKNDIITKMRSGFYLDKEVQLPSEIHFDTDASDDAHGLVRTTENKYHIIEQHCHIDLDDDDFAEPYIVHMRTDTQEIYAIYKRFDVGDIIYNDNDQVVSIDARHFYTKYTFIPAPDGSFYDLGFGGLLSPINNAVDTIINQQIDAGTLANTQAGFFKGVRTKSGVMKFRRGEWKQLKTSGDDIRKSVYPLPVREPSNTLFQLLGFLAEAGERVGSVSDMMSGQTPGQNTPATTAMATLEQGLKVFSAIFKRLWRSQTEEYRKIYRINGETLEAESYTNILDEERAISRDDYEGNSKDIVPTSDPNVASDAQKLLQAQFLKESAASAPNLYNARAVEMRSLEAAGIDGIETLLAPEDQEVQIPPDVQLELDKFQFDVRMRTQEYDLAVAKAEAEIFKKQADALRSYAQAESIGDNSKLSLAQLEIDAMEKAGKVFNERLKVRNDERRLEGVGGTSQDSVVT